jgi:pimeloyl-ACP methyl ester carboxylesterase
MAVDIHELVTLLGLNRVRIGGHDMGLMVAYAYAAQFPQEIGCLALMDAFLRGIGDWKNVWLMRDLWHLHFYSQVPLALVQVASGVISIIFGTTLPLIQNVPCLKPIDDSMLTRKRAQCGLGFEYFATLSMMRLRAFNEREINEPDL